MVIYHLGFIALSYLMPRIIDHYWEEKIWSEDLNFSEVRLIRKPLTMPYGRNQENFSPANISIEIDGTWNRVIGQRFFEDHFEVIILPDEIQNSFAQELHEWMSSFFSEGRGKDIPTSQKLLIKSIFKNYLQDIFFLEFQNPVRIRIEHILHESKSFYSDKVLEILTPPPLDFLIF
ncbi:hypothetical protein [Algoriphagus sanaruensis]|uniref:Uncharacterized protein n=1 Tax=Algoriphagus sanaruensis TaxID=1727163 RepID=A0A142EKQ3_9BACT|nr:hypothetical protein [Algoriphagus sanaruensis]AMQ55708.1 hypothetical protein AO498_04770 [Algoriphagus sanaruensis]